ncbi:acyl-CoA N-acyltransferase [Xylariaceae sp. FL0804]|nr:acyl-CoA N-acyltransferase [Xylariaceae sp. FL0804]
MADDRNAVPVLRLPHPYLTPYFLVKSSRTSDSSTSPLLHLHTPTTDPQTTPPPPEPLHSSQIYFTAPTDPKSSERPPDSNNTPWGRARRAPCSSWVWDSNSSSNEGAPPTLAQAWLLTYVLFTLQPTAEAIRVRLAGAGRRRLAAQLRAVLLAVDHPVASGLPDDEELLLLRAAFWQGAGSPFGPRPAWVPEDCCPAVDGDARSSAANVDAEEGAAGSITTASLPKPLSAYPPTPLCHTMTTGEGIAAWHPRRPAKPRPGSVVYSRWIPHLGETFSMVALDWTDASHLALFHAWQNDPRVSQGWNETGTLAQHREYLRRLDADAHQTALLARFDDVCFAYFEVYWAAEDRLGAHYSPSDFDRGRHSLVGDVRFRGPHRVSAWWGSLVHFLFLDEPRTASVVGEPKSSNSAVLAYDLAHGFALDKLVDLPHKRSAFVRCSRERFFQLAPLHESDKVLGGTMVGLLPKL